MNARRLRLSIRFSLAALIGFSCSAGCAMGSVENGSATAAKPTAATPSSSDGAHGAATAGGQRSAATTSSTPITSAEAPPTQNTQDTQDTQESSEPEPPAAPMPLFGAIMIQQVKDYDLWRTGFDAQLDARKSAGIVAQGIMRGLAERHLVAVWLAVTDVDRIKTYLSDKSLRESMKQAGVQGRPEVHLWSNVEAKMEPGRRDLRAAFCVVRVQDLAQFKTAFAETASARSAAGIVGYSLSQDVDDKHLIYVYLQSESAEQLQAYATARETRQQWRDASAQGVPRVTFVEEGELTLYK
jgi:quinol monooxygenase YgiN